MIRALGREKVKKNGESSSRSTRSRSSREANPIIDFIL
jgi:hypothetical protein